MSLEQFLGLEAVEAAGSRCTSSCAPHWGPGDCPVTRRREAPAYKAFTAPEKLIYDFTKKDNQKNEPA